MIWYLYYRTQKAMFRKYLLNQAHRGHCFFVCSIVLHTLLIAMREIHYVD